MHGERVHAGRHLRGGQNEDVGELLGGLQRRLDAVAAELVGRLLGVVDDVVERDGERVDVGRVEVGAAPALREPLQDLVCDAIALVLVLADLLTEPAVVGEAVEQFAQQTARRVRVVAACSNRLDITESGPRPNRTSGP